jgi:hypothetical protein
MKDDMHPMDDTPITAASMVISFVCLCLAAACVVVVLW